MSVLGRWDLVVGPEGATYPSWFEITEHDGGYAGRFVGVVGSSRPIQTIETDGVRLSFWLQSQYEGFPNGHRFTGEVSGDVLTGTTNNREDAAIPFVGHRAPSLARAGTPIWGETLDLIAGGMEGFSARWPERENFWSIAVGHLVNSGVGTDLVTNAKFEDFRLVAEYSYPKDSNSGIYLRGRYEVQILDDYGQAPHVGTSAGIYGFFAPSINAIHPHGEWNRIEIVLLGRVCTITLNGQVVQDHVEIPGITGGALDSNEGQPGSLLIQGDHGPVTFRRLELTPATF